MALYTITLYNWLQNGFSLPAVFDTVPDISGMNFKTLFTYHFSDWEIGFETEEAFSRKLEAHANMIIPLYVTKIQAIESEYENIFKNETVRRTFINNASISALNDSTGNSAESLETKTPSETLNAIIQFQERVKPIYQALLDEFQSMFMGLC